jgi:hypothetical protein
MKKCLVGFRHLFRDPENDDVFTITAAKMLHVSTISSILPAFAKYCDNANLYEWNTPPNQYVTMLWWLTDEHIWRKKVELSNLPK